MKIGVGVNFFLEGNTLADCLASLRGFDVVFCIDGRYPQFDYPKDLSDDDSRRIVTSFRNTFLINRGNHSQLDKRNEYLRLGREFGCDYVLVCDADCTVEWNKRKLESELRGRHNFVHNILIHQTPSYTFRMGMLLNPRAVEYHEIHHLVRCRKCHFETDLAKPERFVLQSITMYHSIEAKSRAHREGKKAYRVWKQPIENRLRQKRGMLMVPGRDT